MNRYLVRGLGAGAVLGFGVLLFFAACAYQGSAGTVVVLDNRSGIDLTDVTVTVVSGHQGDVLWAGDLADGEDAFSQAELTFDGELVLTASVGDRRLTVGPLSYVSPDLAARHRFTLNADRSIDHYIAKGTVSSEWQLLEVIDAPHERHMSGYEDGDY